VTPFRLLGAVTDLAGDLVETASEAPRALGLPLLEQVADLLERLVARVRADGGTLIGIGVAVPGIPDPAGQSVRFAPAIEWENVPAGRVLQERFPYPVLIQNDVDALLLGERWRGAAAGVRHAAAVMVGSGVGAAVLVDGRLYRGRHGAVGEIGYWLTDSERPLAPGSAGQLEEQVSLGFLARRWARQCGRPPESDTALIAAMTAEALAGPSPAREIVREAARTAGVVICNLVTLLNPEIVIFGGAALCLKSLLLPEIGAMVDRHTLYPVPVVAAQLGDYSALMGCVVGVLEQQRSSVSYVE
jgi:predicted NBD/HSP70 family sugar kinase